MQEDFSSPSSLVARKSFDKNVQPSSTIDTVETSEDATESSIVRHGRVFHNARHRSSHEDDDEWIDFLQDDPRGMTWGRRWALYCKQFAWYNPAVAGSSTNDPKKNTTDPSDRTTNTNNDGDANDRERQALLQASIRAATTEAYPFTVADLGQPSLELAWAYFEHYTLARYVMPTSHKTTSPESPPNNRTNYNENTQSSDKGGEPHSYDRAKPGEQELFTRLYNPFTIPHKQLGDWGLGVGLYFTTLRFMTAIMFLAGCLSLPNILYYSGPEYSQDQENVPLHLKGSAICTDTSWVPCLDCQWEDFPQHRIANVVTSSDGTPSSLLFVLKNNCDGATVRNGMVNLGVLMVVVVGVLIMNWVVAKAEVEFDEDEQTAQDYSIVIKNPPPDAWDPQVWKDWFHDNFDGAHVTVCTIGIDNDLLIRNLVQRRENLRKIEMQVPPGTPLDFVTLAGLASKEEKSRSTWGRIMAKFSPGIPEFLSKVVVSTVKIQGLAQNDHEVSNVFITFETEAEQRRVLEALSIGKYSVKRQDKSALADPEKHLFQGKVLLVDEPEEPSAIRWQDLNATSSDQLKEKLFTMLATFIAIVIISLIVRAVNDVDVRFSAAVIATFNISFPALAKALTNMESHSSESGRQRSLYFKVALARWVNTAVVVTIIFDFTRILENKQGLVEQVFTLFFAEVISNTGLQLLDASGHFRRHFLAPRADNQWSMNLLMSGVDWDLSERYTNMTVRRLQWVIFSLTLRFKKNELSLFCILHLSIIQKILLLAVWYNAVFPMGLFLCSLGLLVNYYSDRFSLMRTWKRVPMLGPRIAEFSRKYFFSMAVVSMALISSYYWSGFPFDNVCESEQGVNGTGTDQSARQEHDYVGDWIVDIKGSGEKASVSVNADDSFFIFCRQDFFRYYDDMRSFPFLPENQPEGLEWMTSDQEFVSFVWGIASMLVIGVALFRLFSYCFSDIKDYYRGGYDPVGEDQNKPFSQEENISAYIPQVVSSVYPHPLLATNFDEINPELLDWEDHEKPYSFYDITKDAKFLLHGKFVPEHVMFSKVAHWPPSAASVPPTAPRTQEKRQQQSPPRMPASPPRPQRVSSQRSSQSLQSPPRSPMRASQSPQRSPTRSLSTSPQRSPRRPQDSEVSSYSPQRTPQRSSNQSLPSSSPSKSTPTRPRESQSSSSSLSPQRSTSSSKRTPNRPQDSEVRDEWLNAHVTV